jgi:hypothetical protein
LKPAQIVRAILSQKNPSQKRAGGLVQGVGPEFKPQYQERKKEKAGRKKEKKRKERKKEENEMGKLNVQAGFRKS